MTLTDRLLVVSSGNVSSECDVASRVLVDLFFENSSRRPPFDWRREAPGGGEKGSDFEDEYGRDPAAGAFFA